jgi:hypothetical protein
VTDIYVADYHEHGPDDSHFENPWDEPYRPPGSITICKCGRQVHLSPMAGYWVPVRWYNFRARRRIAQWKRNNAMESAE